MLLLGERRDSLAGEGVREADALIRQARRRRRLCWLRAMAAIVLVAAGTSTWFLLKQPSGASRAVNAASRPAAPGMCASAVVYGPLPAWARSGFNPPDLAMPHVSGARGDLVAVLWQRRDPLVVPAPPQRNNKILWVSRLPSAGPSLQITAQQLIGGAAVGPVQQRTVAGGPGPSVIDMPAPGCWQFTLHWSGHVDTVDLAYAAG
jgi:hypothetical protein